MYFYSLCLIYSLVVYMMYCYFIPVFILVDLFFCLSVVIMVSKFPYSPPPKKKIQRNHTRNWSRPIAPTSSHHSNRTHMQELNWNCAEPGFQLFVFKLFYTFYVCICFTIVLM